MASTNKSAAYQRGLEIKRLTNGLGAVSIDNEYTADIEKYRAICPESRTDAEIYRLVMLFKRDEDKIAQAISEWWEDDRAQADEWASVTRKKKTKKPDGEKSSAGSSGGRRGAVRKDSDRERDSEDRRRRDRGGRGRGRSAPPGSRGMGGRGPGRGGRGRSMGPSGGVGGLQQADTSIGSGWGTTTPAAAEVDMSNDWGQQPATNGGAGGGWGVVDSPGANTGWGGSSTTTPPTNGPSEQLLSSGTSGGWGTEAIASQPTANQPAQTHSQQESHKATGWGDPIPQGNAWGQAAPASAVPQDPPVEDSRWTSRDQKEEKIPTASSWGAGPQPSPGAPSADPTQSSNAAGTGPSSAAMASAGGVWGKGGGAAIISPPPQVSVQPPQDEEYQETQSGSGTKWGDIPSPRGSDDSQSQLPTPSQQAVGAGSTQPNQPSGPTASPWSQIPNDRPTAARTGGRGRPTPAEVSSYEMGNVGVIGGSNTVVGGQPEGVDQQSSNNGGPSVPTGPGQPNKQQLQLPPPQTNEPGHSTLPQKQDPPDPNTPDQPSPSYLTGSGWDSMGSSGVPGSLEGAGASTGFHFGSFGAALGGEEVSVQSPQNTAASQWDSSAAPIGTAWPASPPQQPEEMENQTQAASQPPPNFDQTSPQPPAEDPSPQGTPILEPQQTPSQQQTAPNKTQNTGHGPPPGLPSLSGMQNVHEIEAEMDRAAAAVGGQVQNQETAVSRVDSPTDATVSADVESVNAAKVMSLKQNEQTSPYDSYSQQQASAFAQQQAAFQQYSAQTVQQPVSSSSEQFSSYSQQAEITTASLTYGLPPSSQEVVSSSGYATQQQDLVAPVTSYATAPTNNTPSPPSSQTSQQQQHFQQQHLSGALSQASATPQQPPPPISAAAQTAAAATQSQYPGPPPPPGVTGVNPYAAAGYPAQYVTGIQAYYAQNAAAMYAGAYAQGQVAPAAALYGQAGSAATASHGIYHNAHHAHAAAQAQAQAAAVQQQQQQTAAAAQGHPAAATHSTHTHAAAATHGTHTGHRTAYMDMYGQMQIQGLDAASYAANGQYATHDSYLGQTHAATASSGSGDKTSQAGSVGSMGLYDPSAQAAMLTSQQGLYNQTATDPNRASTAGGWAAAAPQYTHGATQHQWSQLIAANQRGNPTAAANMHYAQAHTGSQQPQIQGQLFQQYGSHGGVGSSSDGRGGWGR